MSSALLPLLGLVAASTAILTGVPQVVRLLRSSDASGLSPASCLLGTMAAGSWLAYGVLLLDTAQLVANGPGLACALVTLWLVDRRLGRSSLPAALWTAAYAAAMVGVHSVAGIDGIAAVATVIGLARMLPQIRLVLEGGSLAGISPGTYLLTVTSALLWTAYGTGTGQVTVAVGSLLSVLMAGFVLVRRCPPQVVVRALHRGRWGVPGQLLVRPVLGLAV